VPLFRVSGDTGPEGIKQPTVGILRLFLPSEEMPSPVTVSSGPGSRTAWIRSKKAKEVFDEFCFGSRSENHREVPRRMSGQTSCLPLMLLRFMFHRRDRTEKCSNRLILCSCSPPVRFIDFLP